MSAERNFYPLSEANTDRVRTTLRLPYRLEENIGLDTRAVENLCQLAGVTDIKIFRDEGKAMPQIVGFTSKGEALGGSVRTSVDKLSINNNFDDDFPGFLSGRWSHLEIGVREQESVILLESQKKDIQDPKNWAILLDEGIKKGIISSAFNNLVKREPLDVLVTACSAFLILSARNYESALAIITLSEVIDKFTRFSINGSEKSGRGTRWSLAFYGAPELDRMVFLLLKAGATTLAKKI